MSESEFRKKAEEYGYDEEEIDEIIDEFVTFYVDLGLAPTPYEEIPILYKNY